MPSEYKTASARASTLEEETRIVIEEARMVLPGIQTLFGFQLIAVFNPRFQGFSKPEQMLHLLALLLVAAAVALIMTPAAYHRIGQRGTLSRRFIDLASRFLTCAMLPLMLAIAIDSFLVSRLIVGNVGLSGAIALALLLVFFSFWYVFPWTQAPKRRPLGEANNPKVERAPVQELMARARRMMNPTCIGPRVHKGGDGPVAQLQVGFGGVNVGGKYGHEESNQVNGRALDSRGSAGYECFERQRQARFVDDWTGSREFPSNG